MTWIHNQRVNFPRSSRRLRSNGTGKQASLEKFFFWSVFSPIKKSKAVLLRERTRSRSVGRAQKSFLPQQTSISQNTITMVCFTLLFLCSTCFDHNYLTKSDENDWKRCILRKVATFLLCIKYITFSWRNSINVLCCFSFWFCSFCSSFYFYHCLIFFMMYIFVVDHIVILFAVFLVSFSFFSPFYFQ